MITVPIKRCCGVWLGEWCDCAQFAGQAAAALANPIRLPMPLPPADDRQETPR